MKLWQKNYVLNERIEAFTVGDDHILDQHLVKFDCAASIAHAKMLRKIGVLSQNELQSLVQELENIIGLDAKNAFRIRPEDEDCHTAIENHLTRELGDTGKKIHTARSRNDQVLTALRLYEKNELDACKALAGAFIDAVEHFIGRFGEITLPGYTHMRKAMPSSMAMWGTAFMDSMKDNLKLITAIEDIIDQSPSGSGAGYGIPLEIDRAYVAELLDFSAVQQSPIYCQQSRGKFEATIVHVLSQIMFDLNKLASDLILFSMPEFGYFELPQDFCTGSSIMPQKFNPDVLELLRAKYHVVLSYEYQLRSITGNLISGYHRDVQLTKAPLINAFVLTKDCLEIAAMLFGKIEVDAEKCQLAMTNDLYATDKMYALVKNGMSFRDAYRTVSKQYEHPLRKKNG